MTVLECRVWVSIEEVKWIAPCAWETEVMVTDRYGSYFAKLADIAPAMFASWKGGEARQSNG